MFCLLFPYKSPANVALTTPMESVPVSPKSESPQLQLPLRNSPQSWDIPSKGNYLYLITIFVNNLKWSAL